AFDAELMVAGGSPVAGVTFKSTARLLGAPEACAAVSPEWCAGIASATCRVEPPGPSGKVLGVRIAGGDLEGQFRGTVEATAAACSALELLEDAPAELALLRMSTNVCRVVRLLRAAGPEIPEAALVDFDERRGLALSALLWGQLPSACLERAACGARGGGLGLRRAADASLPAFLASRAEARPLAEELCSAMPAQWRELPADRRGFAAQVLAEGAAEAARVAGELTGRLQPRWPAPDLAATVQARIVAHSGIEDPEHPDAAARGGLQARLSDLVAGVRLDGIYAELQRQEDWSGLHLLDDLRDPDTDHSWMWVLSSATGDHVRAGEFVVAVRLRLGAPVLEAPATCACCGGELDRECRHALRCAPGAITRGHNKVRDSLLGLASLSDNAAAVEVPGLVPSHSALLTGAGACAAMVAEKRGKCAHVLPELADEGIEYWPLIWSCWGRPRSDATAAVGPMAAAASRRRGVAAPGVLARRAKALVGVQLWRRAAAMVSACLPSAHPGGVVDVPPAARDRRLPELGLAGGAGAGEAQAAWPGGPVAADGLAGSGGVDAPGGLETTRRGPGRLAQTLPRGLWAPLAWEAREAERRLLARAAPRALRAAPRAWPRSWPRSRRWEALSSVAPEATARRRVARPGLRLLRRPLAVTLAAAAREARRRWPAAVAPTALRGAVQAALRARRRCGTRPVRLEAAPEAGGEAPRARELAESGPDSATRRAGGGDGAGRGARRAQCGVEAAPEAGGGAPPARELAESGPDPAAPGAGGGAPPARELAESGPDSASRRAGGSDGAGWVRDAPSAAGLEAAPEAGGGAPPARALAESGPDSATRRAGGSDGAGVAGGVRVVTLGAPGGPAGAADGSGLGGAAGAPPVALSETSFAALVPRVNGTAFSELRGVRFLIVVIERAPRAMYSWVQ
ncbi:unnamed protein product, partial [Prorocentrum cordatum]